MTTRGSTGGCYNHSATELDMKLGSSLEICRLYKIWSHSSGSQGPLNEFEQVLMITKLSPKVHGGSQTGGMLNFCELLEICNFRQAQAENSAENQLLHWFLKGILTFAQWILDPKTLFYMLHIWKLTKLTKILTPFLHLFSIIYHSVNCLLTTYAHVYYL